MIPVVTRHSIHDLFRFGAGIGALEGLKHGVVPFCGSLSSGMDSFFWGITWNCITTSSSLEILLSDLVDGTTQLRAQLGTAGGKVIVQQLVPICTQG